MNVSQMAKGETRVIREISDDFISLKLLEMGCTPGNKVTYNYKAPFGDPICISVSGYQLTLRKTEAQAITVD